jgi:hypothetical protein
MKKLILIAALIGFAGSVLAQEVTITREELGSGQVNTTGVENATNWDNDIYHAPQYMPGHPTAATLYPRVVDVECTRSTTGLNCKGYHWTPDMGRGEYLMIHPHIVEPQEPIIITRTVTNTIEVIKETTKKIAE